MDHDPGVGADRGALDGTGRTPTRIEGGGTVARRPGTAVETPAGPDATPPCMVRQAAATSHAPTTAATQAAPG